MPGFEQTEVLGATPKAAKWISLDLFNNASLLCRLIGQPNWVYMNINTVVFLLK